MELYSEQQQCEITKIATLHLQISKIQRTFPLLHNAVYLQRIKL